MRKGGGYVLTAYYLDLIGPDEILTTYLCDSVRRSLRYDDRATAITWAGQILAALRDFAGRFDGHPPEALIRANRDISRRLAHYIHQMDLPGGNLRG